MNDIKAKIEALKEQAAKLGYSSTEGLTLRRGEVVPKGMSPFDQKLSEEVFTFDNLSSIENTPGLYHIYTFDGTPLKVGISNNLRKRLRAHYQSKQKYLHVKAGTSGEHPSDIVSKRSILAKHLYFDEELTQLYDLKTERGRQSFLNNECYVIATQTNTRDEARALEIKAEECGIYRYARSVLHRMRK